MRLFDTATIAVAGVSPALQVIGPLLAQMPIPDFGNLSSTAVLIWYAWWTTSRTIPGLAASFRAEMAIERETHAEERRAYMTKLDQLDRSITDLARCYDHRHTNHEGATDGT
jgi:hypothetical protein